MQRAAVILGCLFTLSSCSILKPKDQTAGGGGGEGGGGQVGKGWSDTFTEAPSFKLGTPVEAKTPPCNGNGFLKLEIEQDKPFHVVAKSPTSAANSCAYVEIVNGNAAAANTPGSSVEVCNETKTIDSKGQPGGTYIVVQEKYGCAGITVSLALNDGPAGAAPAAAPTTSPATGPKPEQSDGPKPEN
jgi:hypothetical protein